MSSGWDQSRLERGSSEYLKHFKCTICSHIMKDAVQLPCGHSFCSSCIHNVKPHKCPMDQKEFTLNSVMPNFVARSAIDDLSISCRYKPHCDHVGKVLDISKHENECTTREVQCKKGCGQSLHVSKISSHDCLTALKDAVADQKRIIQILQSDSSIASDSDASHFGVICKYCEQDPIRGLRYKCLTCYNVDTCFKCLPLHDRSHWMVVIRYPQQGVDLRTTFEQMDITSG